MRDILPLLSHEPVVRFGFFLGVFALMALYEFVRPARRLLQHKVQRWSLHFGLLALNTLTLRFIFPGAAVGIALITEHHEWGLLFLFDLPIWAGLVIALLVLDFSIWAEHIAFHKIPLLWRLHRVHHSDHDVDVTTALRFHPLEILLSMVFKSVVIILLGASAMSVLIFEVLLNANAMFNHSNVRLPQRIETPLRFVLVTPDMHRIHHSVRPQETDSNYGFQLSVWDRLFGTYTQEPQDGQDGMQLGLKQYSTNQSVNPFWVLFSVFKRR